MNRAARTLPMLAGAWALASAAPPVRAAMDLPAVIEKPDAASRAEIRRVVSEALDGQTVTLAADVLTSTGTLVVEHARPRDAGGRLLNGRDLGRPARFELVKRGRHCVLIEAHTGRRWTLRETRCAAHAGG